MSFGQLIKTALITPSKLDQSKKTKGWKVFLYLLLLSIITMLPILNSAMTTLDTLTADGEKISQSLPAFQVKDGKLVTKNKGYIYQTSHLIFTFDPLNKQSTQDIKNDLGAEQIGIALQKDQIVLAMPSNSIVDGSGLTNPMAASYKSLGLESLNKDELTQLLVDSPLVAPFMIIMMIVSFLSSILSVTFNLLILSFAATFYSKLSRMNLSFGENFKICTFASTWATIVSALLQWFNPASTLAGLTMLITLVIYFSAVQSERPSINQ